MCLSFYFIGVVYVCEGMVIPKGAEDVKDQIKVSCMEGKCLNPFTISLSPFSVINYY